MFFCLVMRIKQEEEEEPAGRRRRSVADGG
jgi:hypothetical protein